MSDNTLSLGVVGGGAWGTALASVAARNGLSVRLWAREPEVVEDVNVRHVNSAFLPEISLPTSLKAVDGFADLSGCNALLIVSPVQFTRLIISDLKPFLSASTPLVLCSKGIEQSSLSLMSVVVGDVVPENPILVLSGPSFAADVAQDRPTAVTLATAHAESGRMIAQALSRPTFRIYLSDDVIGAQVGGAVKNVMAIACGIVEGKALGDSARAALIARGFVEMQRLAVALGGKAATLSGLSGLGDLILTCTSQRSRNMSLGFELGQGRSVQSVLAERRSVAEGVYTAQAVAALAQKHGIEMPISDAVHDIVRGARGVDEAIEDLLNRPTGVEEEG